ncbi:MAG: aspartyl/asparaginyl beta-hydroxylase domain-containing protein [Pseudomonadota bacterium]
MGNLILLQHQVLERFREGGLFERVMHSGGHMDRMKGLLRLMSEPPHEGDQRPFFFCPDLRSQPFYPPDVIPACSHLMMKAASIIAEWRQNRSGLVTYTPQTSGPVGPTQIGLWQMALLRYMGAPGSAAFVFPETAAVTNDMPRFTGGYPWGDALFSVHGPGTRLHPHCSVDNFRVRIHLGIDVPQDAQLRVHDQVQHWQAGQCLAFDDSFEHETHNGSGERVVLIVDTWHPDLSDAETEFLTAAFNHRQVKALFFDRRLKNTNISDDELRQLSDGQAHLHEQALASGWWS